MQLPDVNVLVHSHREDVPCHAGCHQWLESLVNGDDAFGLSWVMLKGFVRVVTHPKAFVQPSRLADALEVTEQLRSRPQCVQVMPGPRHWTIFRALCEDVLTHGNLVAVAYLAAMAIDAGCEWVTTDRDFSRSKGRRWRHPLRWPVPVGCRSGRDVP